VLEPACGLGYMAEVLKEYFSSVEASDIYPYGYAPAHDFLRGPALADSVDWIVTNPPFKSAEEFVLRGLTMARRGVAVLVRTVFIESVGRYQRLFRETPCDIFAQFTERVPIVRGRVDPKATTATGYAWLIWKKPSASQPAVVWIPPCRKALQRVDDYTHPATRKMEKSGRGAGAHAMTSMPDLFP
jgi:hypothetical protein